ncbi:MAG TPA: YbfB/YjiJ family MFS transporter [Burkholderiaceae bacterium]|nr:YbfB/YjiJ family MFS transporter [Burkholderiaceae bacterium]
MRRALNGLSLAGLSATLVGNGVGRFAFIAMMPAVIDAAWFSKAEASHLSVATLLGYIVGAWRSDKLARRWSSATLIRACMLLTALSFYASAFAGWPLWWYYAWRLLAGACGAVLMVLPAPVVLPRHDPLVRARASAVVFSGVGLGAALSGLLVPALIGGVGLTLVYGKSSWPLVFKGVTGAWLGLGTLCLVLTIASWTRWTADAATPAAGSAAPATAANAPQAHVTVVHLIVAAHALNAIGYLAHTMFLVDYVVHEVGASLAAGGFYWSMFGLGAAVGPVITGPLADRYGTKRCLAVGFAAKSLAAVLPVLSSRPSMLLASALLMGLCTPGLLALVSAYTLEIVGAQDYRQAWGKATFGFSVAQGVGGFAMAIAASHLASYKPLMMVSALALIGAIACLLAISGRQASFTDVKGEVS